MNRMDAQALAERLRAMEAGVVPAEDRERSAGILSDAVRAQFRAVNEGDAEAWARIRSKADWERFRDERIGALRRSLGTWPPEPERLDVVVTRTVQGDGFRIENLVFESRPGLIVPANLYLPDPPREAMPGILICHSHHRPKTQGELQDMGMTWARLGAMVLVPDQLGHGERRQQPFGGREDYHHRHVIGMQLHLVGESLIGWMAWDLMRCLDLLLSRPGIDREKVILLGAVAGGGDPAAVVVALDPRITCSVPFNFGSPETLRGDPRRPDAPREQNVAGNGSWESTRNLRLNARDGFLPWVIVAAAGPRYLVSAHEFEWAPERDLVWGRLKRIYGFYKAAERLAYVHGWGGVTKQPPAASHCTNIGPPHRKMLYPALERWFAMPIPEPEYQQRLEPEELDCVTPEVVAKFKRKMLCELAAQLAAERTAAAREALARLTPAERRLKLREDWAQLMGDVEPDSVPVVTQRAQEDLDGVTVERIVLEVAPGIVVPTLLLVPRAADAPARVVVGVAHEGKERFLKERAGEIADLLRGGTAVCLPDLRGTGETRPGEGHGWQEEWDVLAIWVSASELMFGRTLLGLRLRDLRSVLRYLRTRADLDASRIALWGDAFSPVNPESFEDPPLKTDHPPHLAEPMGQLVAFLGALFEEDVKAVLARRGLVGFASVLAAPFCYIPHDVHLPGVLEVGDISDVAAALAPLPLRIEAPVDGRNRAVADSELNRWFEPVRKAYADHPQALHITSRLQPDVAHWLSAALDLKPPMNADGR